MRKNQPTQLLVLDTMLGLAVGDALGAPKEFLSREEAQNNPMTEMPEYSLFTDDTSMNLCLLDSLIRYNPINYTDIMNNFILWVGNGVFTPEGRAFGMGITTMNALKRFAVHKDPLTSGSTDEFENGNGALMRILPLSFYLVDHFKESFLDNREAFKVVQTVITLTHAHPRNVSAVTIYLAIAEDIIDARLAKGLPLTYLQFKKAIIKGAKRSLTFLSKEILYRSQVPYFSKLMMNPKTNAMNLETFQEKEIKSSGYVIDTLEAALWCCLTSPNYSQSVLKAANLGDDADTVAAVTGGLAGLAYSQRQIPKAWMDRMVRLDLVIDLATDYQAKLKLKTQKKAN